MFIDGANANLGGTTSTVKQRQQINPTAGPTRIDNPNQMASQCFVAHDAAIARVQMNGDTTTTIALTI